MDKQAIRKEDSFDSVVDEELSMLEARKCMLFEYVQTLYNKAQVAHSNDARKEDFLNSIQSIEDIRAEFKTVINEHNRALLRSKTGAVPNYQPIIAFEDLYCRIKRVLKQLEPATAPAAASPSRADCDSMAKSRPALPVMEIMSFDGDIKNWPLFYASFKSRVHDNPSLSDDERLYYLIGKLSPRAQAVFSGIVPSADNYKLILNSLVDRYQDTRTLASTYLDQMLSLKINGPASSSNFQTFMDKFVTSANALKSLKLDDLTDYMLLHIALKKLDEETIRAFEMQFRNVKIPKFNDLTDFVKSQFRIYRNTQPLASAGTSRSESRDKIIKSVRLHAPNPQSYVASANSHKCICNDIVHDHFYKCPAFNKLTPSQRFQCVKEHSACVNCLSVKHRTRECNSNSKCRSCSQNHHTLLHFDKVNITSPRAHTSTVNENLVASPLPTCTRQLDAVKRPTEVPAPPTCNTSVLTPVYASCSKSANQNFALTQQTVLLSTARVVIYDASGHPHLVKCLLDSASQSSFITQDCCMRLGLEYHTHSYTIVRGIGGSEKPIKGTAMFKIFSRFNEDVNFEVSGLVVDHITGNLPSVTVDVSEFTHIQSLPLADDTFDTPAEIDMLIGAKIFPHLLLPNIVQSDVDGIPPAIETVFGYIVMGSAPTLQVPHKYSSSCCAYVQESLDHLLKRFWELEEITASPAQTKDDRECEHFFAATTSRDDTGRYTVALPFKKDPFDLGESHCTAQRRFLCLERKLQASKMLKAAYDNVIIEYVNKGYITKVPHDTDTLNAAYHIPHHAVVREDKTTTKVRMVLDSSCKTSTCLSLNDVLHSGPNLQGDIFSILLNFRLFRIALSADCRQMFLQIGIRESDRKFQRILYRFHSDEPISVYEFNRVCFGMKSSPYHALRVIHQLIADDGHRFPTAAAIASSSTYMDDVCFSIMAEDSSMNDESLAVSASKELIDLFKSGQFDLVKWTSNSDAVLREIPATHRESVDLEMDRAVSQKVLGLCWNKSSDYFYFKVTVPDLKGTKRAILSVVARLWDNLGLVAPVTLYAKIIIQELWILKCDWDEAPPPSIANAWEQFCLELPRLNEIEIPRHLGIVQGSTVNLLGFSDASERGYGGVVYMQVINDSDITVRLVCSKSKVTPLKTISIARLELCATLLLSKLMRKVLDNFEPRYKIENVYAFTDSKVVLCWISSSPHRWQTFVANRVVQILENVPASCFHHVAGLENPADCLSRGLTPSKLIDHPLWFNGPQWALKDPSEWSLGKIDCGSIEVPESKPLSFTVTSTNLELPLYTLAKRLSSWSKLLRTIVYIYRFIRVLPRDEKVSRSQLEFAEKKVVTLLQNIHFKDDIRNLETNQPCAPVLQKLRPYLDEDKLIRVGGRLSNADIPYSQKHPYVLPRRDHIVTMIIDYYHRKYLHAGPETLMSLLRHHYWIIAARRIIRYCVFKCNTCFKSKPRPTLPQMADLPKCRVNQVDKPFSHTGCDFAGPLQYTPVRGRGIKSRKIWLCIFTCMTTRCLHIELATELSTVNFLNALKRFLARRGPVQCMYTDHGTNFVGARSYLRDLYKFLDEYRPHFEHELSEHRIDWKFIPPASPHFGGCWESMVKVVKTHLFKVIGQQILSYEELSTVLTQVEALVNSRPLTAMSSDPAEPSALTPAHFLHTAPLFSLPAPLEESANLLERHALLNKIVQSFWQRWRVEYLHQLQSRAKWTIPSTPIQIGTVVIIITDNAPPLSWPLGVIEAVHSSKDGVVRVVTVRTSKGSYVRPVVRLCPLPNQ